MATFLAGKNVLAETLEDLVDDWETYTPTITTSGTQPTIGNGTVTGVYKQIGKVVHVHAAWLFGSTSAAGTGQWNVSLPITASQPGHPLNNYYIGPLYMVDGSLSQSYIGVTVLTGSTNMTGYVVSSAAGLAASVGGTTPFAWANTDRVNWYGTYRAA